MWHSLGMAILKEVDETRKISHMVGGVLVERVPLKRCTARSCHSLQTVGHGNAWDLAKGCGGRKSEELP